MEDVTEKSKPKKPPTDKTPLLLAGEDSGGEETALQNIPFPSVAQQCHPCLLYQQIVWFWTRHALLESLVKRAWTGSTTPVSLTRDQAIEHAQRIEHVFAGGRVVTEQVWPPVLGSLLLHDVISYASSPESRVSNSVKRLLFWFTQNTRMLMSQGPRSWEWHVLWIGGMLLLGLGNGFRHWREARNLRHVPLESTLMGDSESSIENVASMLFAGDVKNQIKAVTQQKLLQALRDHANSHNTFTRFAAMQSIGHVINAYREGALNTLASERREDLRALRGLAIRYLREMMNSPQSSVAKRLYANYQLWSTGYGHNYRWDPLFIVAALGMTYAKYRFWLSLLQPIIERIVYDVEKHRCTTAGKTYHYMYESASDECTVCGNWTDVYYANMFDPQACITDYLQVPQTPSNITQALQQLEPLGISGFDLSQQAWTEWSLSDLKAVFSALQKTSQGKLDYCYLNVAFPMVKPLPSATFDSICAALKSIEIREFSGVNLLLPANSSHVLVESIAGGLNALDLTGTGLSVNDAKPLGIVLAKQSSLRSLILANNQLDNDAMTILSPYLKDLPLEHVSIAGNTCNEVGIQALSQNPLTELKSVDFSRLPLESRNLTAVQAVIKKPHLTVLTMQEAGITAPYLSEFTTVLNQSRVSIIDLSGNRLTSTAGLILSRDVQGSSVTELHLNNNVLSDQGMATLFEGLQGNNSVVKIGLQQNVIGDLGFKYACQYWPATQVVDIDLSQNQLSERGMAYCAPMLNEVKATRLVLDDNFITDTGLYYLLNSTSPFWKHLNTLGLKNTGLLHIEVLLDVITRAQSPLKHLNIAKNMLVEVDYLKAIALLPKTQLKQLILSDTRMSPAVARALTAHIETLQPDVLDLSKNNLDDPTVLGIGRTLLKPSLRTGLLDRENIKPDVYRLIHASNASTPLTTLNVEETNITTRAARGICAVAPSTHLRMPQLTLTGNAIDEHQINLHSCQTSAASSLRPSFVFRYVDNAVKKITPSRDQRMTLPSRAGSGRASYAMFAAAGGVCGVILGIVALVLLIRFFVRLLKPKRSVEPILLKDTSSEKGRDYNP